ncbi:phosphate acyltransferase PlsX [Geothrix sp. 21YS21S-2]|uniref:phosphate acyltransferase PlsX n=1 Tax=Geothrix sp. 21YS21S-2 TaxID=3068893 RepID=UPI0027B9B9DE|nr:phosphate acyltransferase PlsX [Geothrix sp. 21YS21S-2]
MDAPAIYRIALDVMGGDNAPVALLEGARAALNAHPELFLHLVGDEDRLRPLLGHFGLKGDLSSRFAIVHAASVVDMDDKATSILKEKKDSSIRVAAQLVREGKADGVVSMGHTGAAMVASKMVLGTLPGVDRPCLATILPNMTGRPTVLLDVGANIDCRPEHIAQFAVMGSVYAEEVLGIARPRVGVLSVGEEEGKGSTTTREAAQALKDMDLNFTGNAEGRDIWNGKFDVIACDGFVGNALLKSAEALAEGLIQGMKGVFKENLLTKLGALLTMNGLKRFAARLDYAEYGGAPLLGVKGISIIGHGRSNSKAVHSAIRAALMACEHGVNDHIQETLGRLMSQAGTQETS